MLLIRALHDSLTASPSRLRFELNTGGSYIAMFTMAYDRARTLARAAIGPGPLAAVIAADPGGWHKPWSEQKFGPRRDSAFDMLADIGVAAAPQAEWEQPPFPEAEDARPWSHRAVTIGWAEADILLWNALAQDIGIRFSFASEGGMPGGVTGRAPPGFFRSGQRDGGSVHHGLLRRRKLRVGHQAILRQRPPGPASSSETKNCTNSARPSIWSICADFT